MMEGPVGRSGRDGLDRNLRLIPWHHGLARALVWMPVFVLFTRARFDLDGAILLASLYYLFVVAVEVPSGWMSDRLGRVVTLRLAAVGFIGAQLCFLFGDRFLTIVAGQLLMAVGFASLSGTDVAFHYDTLEALDRQRQFPDRQARVAAIGFGAAAASAIAGGLLGLIDLRHAFAASLVLNGAQFALTLLLVEPPATTSADPIGRQVVNCLRYLADRPLAWIFFYGIVLVTLEHVAVTLLAPWLTEVLNRDPDDVGATPLFAGVVFAAVSTVGAGAARASTPLSRRLGPVLTLLGLAALSALIVTGMALWVHVAVIALVLFRSAQGAAAPVVMSAVVAPRTEQRHRATFLSLNSLAGRLGYGVLLVLVSTDAQDDTQRVLGWFAMLSWTLVAVLAVTAALTVPRTGVAASPGRPESPRRGRLRRG